jgi:hypothetical protein
MTFNKCELEVERAVERCNEFLNVSEKLQRSITFSGIRQKRLNIPAKLPSNNRREIFRWYSVAGPGAIPEDFLK